MVEMIKITFSKPCFFLILLLVNFLFGRYALAAPIAQNDERTLPRNGASQTINVLENDTTTDGDGEDLISVIAVTAPIDADTGLAFGAVAIDAANQVIFTPPFDFGDEIQTVTFSYTSSDEVGDTDEALVTISLTGPFASFSEGENELNLAIALESVCDEYLGASDAELTAGQALLRNQCLALEAITGNNPDDTSLLNQIIDQITPEESVAQTRLAVDNNRTQVKTVAQRVQQQRVAAQGHGARNHFALNDRGYVSNLPLAPGAGDENWGSRPRWGVFANAQIDTAEREKTALENGYDADTQGLTVGADYFLNTNTLLGSTFAYTTNDLEYANSDGELDADVTTMSIFGAYFVDDFSFYAQATYAWLDYASQRNISYGSGDIQTLAMITSTTGGVQTGFNSRADWQWQKDAFTLTPYARLDFLNTEVDAYEEVGTSGLEMAIGKQQSSQLSAAIGLQTTYVMNMSWGVLIPNLELAYLSEANSDRDPITARFAVDTDPSRTYSIANDGGDSSFYQLTVGASAIFPRGISAFFNYSGFFGYQYLDASQIQFGIRSEF